MSDLIVGIDLGTTNSEVAAFVDGQVRVLGSGQTNILPSVVGLAPDETLLVGEPARNQLALYPERTVRSIKRKMGSEETVALGNRRFTPPEISALILRELADWTLKKVGQPVHKAVITVPAYFSDAQRQATREAASLAGLEAIRILNEPTAASLAYGEGTRHTAMVYDLGGGTFDVSIVALEGDITEVLASHGDNHLGGDDFNDLLAEHLLEAFKTQHGIDLRQGHPVARARLWWAAEQAKKRLSFEPEVTVREEALVTENGRPLHLELEVTREEYEAMIRPLLDKTLASVSQALADSRKSPGELDAILLVGGATRTPLVSRLLKDCTGLVPREEIHPDLCVALGAGVLASRLAGQAVERVLVDVSPYSFGISFLGERGGVPYPHCYKSIIRRNTPLPLSRTERFYTCRPFQDIVEICVFEGEDEDALNNILVGNFKVKDLKQVPELSEVLCRMSLDLDGILHVTAVERLTGKSKHITIDRALKKKSDGELAEARKRLQALYARGAVEDEGEQEAWLEKEPEEVEEGLERGVEEEEITGGNGPSHAAVPTNSVWGEAVHKASQVVERSRGLLEQMHEDDRDEVVDLQQKIETGIAARDERAVKDATQQLSDLLFFAEGKG
jgi:molecular chaperone DnaK